MTFYLIGLGLNENSISIEALRKLKECNLIYLENYTVNLPYSKEDLEKVLNIKIIQASREIVENESILKEANNKEIALLIYGDPLSATTHSSLIISCIEKDIPYKIFHNASIITTISETGLQPYKFGKITSMPDWKEHTNKPTSFAKIIKENNSIESHTLILTDINLELKDAINELEESCKKEKVSLPEKIIILSNAGTSNQKIFYNKLENLTKKEINLPYCIIIPSKLHFIEKDFLENVKGE